MSTGRTKPPSPDERSLQLLDEGDCAAPLSTGDMARCSGSTLRTVRFYEQEGLIEPLGRSECGHRLFGPGQLDKLKLALDLREAGLAIQDIKHLFQLKSRYGNAREASAEVTALVESQIDALQEKIATLRRLREELTQAVSVISECGSCEEQRFPSVCGDCDVLERPALPRAVKVLWT